MMKDSQTIANCFATIDGRGHVDLLLPAVREGVYAYFQPELTGEYHGASVVVGADGPAVQRRPDRLTITRIT